ncbi:hypothetical protein ACE1CI_20100 [Aerosakkonemataceae cyanobacterium BLCC-F50]|uniref:Uncharacterized protein n=1 Tax=Floridaenema flaviceps BLCC-F50 TaxID=3153642 RepID=A0ABV4XVW3_9CYAN
MDNPTLFDLKPYSKDIIYHPDWEDMQGEDEVILPRSHVEETRSHVGVTCEPNQPTCEQPYQWVEIYPVKQENFYYRYSYIDRSDRIHRVVKHHIPGGNTASPLAINRMREIENAISCGAQPSQIEAMIKAWRKHTKISGNK